MAGDPQFEAGGISSSDRRNQGDEEEGGKNTGSHRDAKNLKHKKDDSHHVAVKGLKSTKSFQSQSLLVMKNEIQYESWICII